MLDVRRIEKDPAAVKLALLRRGEISGLDTLLESSQKRRDLIVRTEELQRERNQLNQKMKGASKEEIEVHRNAMKELSKNTKNLEIELKQAEEILNLQLLQLPNIPAEDIPDGADEDANVEIKCVLELPNFDFEPLDHQTLGENLGLIDAARAAKISGARFTFLSGDLCRLNRALTNYMMDYHRNRGDTELWTPYLVNREAMTNTGQLPKFEDDAFKILHGEEGEKVRELFLIPTAEVPLTNYFAGEIIEEEKLPIRVCGHTPCFRAEAGSAGRDTRGLIRQHQFDKVEMVRIATPEMAAVELQKMVERASGILSELGLAHRIVELCAGDIGFSAERTFDLEVWLPSQNTYREISSCSSFSDFQSRRAKIRYRPTMEKSAKKKNKPQLAVTLNGSGLAIGRTLVAILENFQQEDGSVVIPEVLRPYLGGQDRICKSSTVI